LASREHNRFNSSKSKSFDQASGQSILPPTRFEREDEWRTSGAGLVVSTQPGIHARDPCQPAPPKLIKRKNMSGRNVGKGAQGTEMGVEFSSCIRTVGYLNQLHKTHPIGSRRAGQSRESKRLRSKSTANFARYQDSGVLVVAHSRPGNLNCRRRHPENPCKQQKAAKRQRKQRPRPESPRTALGPWSHATRALSAPRHPGFFCS